MDAKSSVCFSDEGARKVMKLNMRGVLRQFKNAKFLDPLFEAIANALDAGAKKIEIELFEDKDGLDVNPKPLLGYSVKDDGEGFTKKNRAAFSELYTDNRKDIGGKGSGRFKALVVFEHVDIESFTGEEHVSLRFSKAFDGEDDFIIEREQAERETTLTFTGRNDSFTKKEFPTLGAKEVEDAILQHFLPRLVLLKEYRPDGSITVISASGDSASFSYCNLPKMEERYFSVPNVDSDFKLCSCVLTRPAKESCAWFCANGRAVQKIQELKEINSMPGDRAIIIFVSGDYLDENVSDDRTSFSIDKENGLFVSLDKISHAATELAISVIKRACPQLDAMNDAAIQGALEEAPALARYIRTIKPSVVLDKAKILDRARKEFLDERVKAREEFRRLLSKAKVSDEQFRKNAEKVSEMAHIELAEYILYRQAIVDALADLPKDKTSKEKRLHDLLMPMQTEVRDEVPNKHRLTNLWLLDDAFMNYLYAASDKRMAAIQHALKCENEPHNPLARPDLFVFFNRHEDEGVGDALIIEFKGVNASDAEKAKAINELPTNIAEVRTILGQDYRLWGYIITKLDEKLRFTLSANSYRPMINVDGEPNAFYIFMDSNIVNAYVIVMDIDWIATQANLRNKTFMDILTDYESVSNA